MPYVQERSPYLDRPLRTIQQAHADMRAERAKLPTSYLAERIMEAQLRAYDGEATPTDIAFMATQQVRAELQRGQS